MCLEVITLNSFGEKQEDLQRVLFTDLIPEILRKENVIELKIYQSTKGVAEIAVALSLDEGLCGTKGSFLGQRISAALTAFGSVSHSVWKEMSVDKK